MMDQLINIYYTKEPWHTKRLSKEGIRRYFEDLQAQEGLIIAEVGTKLIGYVEFWRITKAQLIRVLFNKPFHIGDEDIRNGTICYIHNFYIDEAYRGRKVSIIIRRLLFKCTTGCTMYCGKEQKRDGRFRIYQRRA